MRERPPDILGILAEPLAISEVSIPKSLSSTQGRKNSSLLEVSPTKESTAGKSTIEPPVATTDCGFTFKLALAIPVPTGITPGGGALGPLLNCAIFLRTIESISERLSAFIRIYNLP